MWLNCPFGSSWQYRKAKWHRNVLFGRSLIEETSFVKETPYQYCVTRGIGLLGRTFFYWTGLFVTALAWMLNVCTITLQNSSCDSSHHHPTPHISKQSSEVYFSGKESVWANLSYSCPQSLGGGFPFLSAVLYLGLLLEAGAAASALRHIKENLKFWKDGKTDMGIHSHLSPQNSLFPSPHISVLFHFKQSAQKLPVMFIL